MLKKSFGYYIEKYGGIIWGLIGFIISFWIIKPNFNNTWIYLFSKASDIGIGTFGFLLTILAIIVQSDSTGIRLLKSRDILYKRLILFNKRAVFLSIVLCVYSVVTLSLKGLGLSKYDIITNLGISFYLFLFIWFLYDIFLFIWIFYKIILIK